MVVPILARLTMLEHLHRPHHSLSVCPASLVRRLVLSVWLVLVAAAVIGQDTVYATPSVSAVFPADRHRELRNELDYTAPDEEDEVKEIDTEGDAWDWDFFDFDFSFSSGTSIVIFVILLGLLGFLIYRMLGDVSLRKRTLPEEEEDQINVEELEEEQLVAEGVSLSLLERAERAGRYDVAVRLLYIQSLKELQDAGMIRYRKDFSNRDYQRQLEGRALLSDFRAVTRQYERYWFGKYPIDRLSYRTVYQRFTALTEQIRESAPKASADA